MSQMDYLIMNKNKFYKHQKLLVAIKGLVGNTQTLDQNESVNGIVAHLDIVRIFSSYRNN